MKRITLALVVVAATLIVFAWSQPWAMLQGQFHETYHRESATGVHAAPALLPIALTAFVVLLLMLTLSRRVSRLLGIGLLGLGIVGIVHALTAHTRSVDAAREQILDIHHLVSSPADDFANMTTSTTPMWMIAIVGCALLAAAGILALITAPSWGSSSARFERRAVDTTPEADRNTRRADQNITQWDQLSAGDDPTRDATR